MAQIERTFGKGAVMRLGDNVITVLDAIPTDSIGLDLALGIGLSNMHALYFCA